MQLHDLRSGDIGFGPIRGAAGALVGLGQLMLGDEARFRHVFVVVEAGSRMTFPYGVEAMPRGARLVSIGPERLTGDYVYVRLSGPDSLGEDIGRHALNMEGTPYGFSDYLALTLKHWGIRSRVLDWWISREDGRGYPRRAICSQLADKALSLAGVQVFSDGRLSQDVTPGALFYQLLKIGGQAYWPGRE